VPRRTWPERVEDIIAAIERVDSYIAGLDFEGFRQDQKTVDAVVRNLEVIGEASHHIPDEIQQRNTEIPWREMRAMRNLISHAYFVVDVTVVWKTAKDDLPGLLPRFRDLIRRKE
jgi:uncharacterized protein with HEPN domain